MPKTPPVIIHPRSMLTEYGPLVERETRLYGDRWFDSALYRVRAISVLEGMALGLFVGTLIAFIW